MEARLGAACKSLIISDLWLFVRGLLVAIKKQIHQKQKKSVDSQPRNGIFPPLPLTALRTKNKNYVTNHRQKQSHA